MSTTNLSLASPAVDYSTITRIDDDYNGSEDSDGIYSYYADKTEVPTESFIANSRSHQLTSPLKYSTKARSPVRPIKSPQRLREQGGRQYVSPKGNPILRHKPARYSLQDTLKLPLIHKGGEEEEDDDDELEQLKERFKKIGLENDSDLKQSSLYQPTTHDTSIHDFVSDSLQAENEHGSANADAITEGVRQQSDSARQRQEFKKIRDEEIDKSQSHLGWSTDVRTEICEKPSQTLTANSEWDTQEPISALRSLASPVSSFHKLQLSSSPPEGSTTIGSPSSSYTYNNKNNNNNNNHNKPLLTRQTAAERQLLDTLDQAKRILEHDVTMVLLERVVSDTICLYDSSGDNTHTTSKNIDHIDKLCLSLSDYILQIISSEKHHLPRYTSINGNTSSLPATSSSISGGGNRSSRYGHNRSTSMLGNYTSYSSPSYHYEDFSHSNQNYSNLTSGGRNGHGSAEKFGGLSRSGSYRMDLSNQGSNAVNGSPMSRLGRVSAYTPNRVVYSRRATTDRYDDRRFEDRTRSPYN